MALSGFGKSRQDDGVAPSTTTSTSSGSSSSGFGNLTAFIDQGSEFEGKLSFKDTVRIDGRFTGEISSENTLIVGESGVIEANIISPSVVISGTVTGDVSASQKLVLHKSARLEGDVKTPVLVMEEGASINGCVEMSSGAGQAKKKPDAVGEKSDKGAAPAGAEVQQGGPEHGGKPAGR